LGGLGDAASSFGHAIVHGAEMVGDAGVKLYHQGAAAGDALLGDQPAADDQMAQGRQADADMRQRASEMVDDIGL
jgi:hypothetical protein